MVVTYETVRQWGSKFGQGFANEIRRRQPRRGDKWQAARKEILPGMEHPQHRYLKNRAEVSHQPARQQERQMRGFKSPHQAQRFLYAHGPIANLFRPPRHQMKVNAFRIVREQAFKTCPQVTRAPRPQQAVTGLLT